jgi:hypothetical protein
MLELTPNQIKLVVKEKKILIFFTGAQVNALACRAIDPPLGIYTA